MWLLLDGAVKVTVLLLIPYVVALFLRRASASVWHVLWAGPLIWSLALPGLLVVLPTWHVLPRWAEVEVKGAREYGSRDAGGAMVRGDAGLPEAAKGVADLPVVKPETEMAAGVKGAGEAAAGGAVRVVVARAGRLPSAESVVLGIYFGGVVACLMPVLVAVVMLRRIEKRAVVARAGRVSEIFGELVRGSGLEGRVRLLESGEPTMPMTWGLVRARILLPAEAEGWAAERVRCVLLHELAHVRRRDVVTGLLGRVACAVYWFHPLAWVAAAQMRAAAERACDDMVLSQGTKASAYAEELMGLTERLKRVRMAGLTAFHAIAMARGGRGSALHGRVKAILDGGRNRGRVSRWVAVGTMVGLLAVVLPLATLAVRGQGTSAPARDTGGVAARPAGNSVSGIVFDEQDRPAAGVVVTRQFVDRRFQIDSIASATTGADGRFTMALDAAATPSGNYVAFTADRLQAGYLSYTQGAAPAAELQITLRAVRVLPVNVVDGGGRPVAGATAVAGVTSPLASATTDGAGKATLALPADAPLEFVEAYKAGVGLDYALFWRKDQMRIDPYRLEPDAKGPVTLKLDGAKPVTVTVVDGNNQPLAGVTVRPWYFTRPNRGSMLNVRMPAFLRRTDASGRATFDFFPADNVGSIELLVTKDGMISTDKWLFDPAISSDQIRATLATPVHVTGKVMARDGAPAGGTTVYVRGLAYVLDSFSKNTVTAADGSFSFDVYPDHFYMFLAQKDHDVSPLASMTIRAASPAPVVLTLQPGIRVFGTMTAGEGRKPVADDQIGLIVETKLAAESPEAQALPNPHKVAGPISNGITRSALSKADGSYEFYALPGSYNLYALYYDEAPLNSFDLGNAPEFKADLHATRALNAPLEFHGRVVKGEQGEPVAEAKLTGIPAGDVFSQDLAGVSDKEGMFTMNRAPAEMWVHAVSRDQSAAALVLVGQQEDQVAIPLSPAASARGRLVDGQGKPLASETVFIEVYPPGPPHVQNRTYVDRVNTDKAGVFELKGLVVGVQYTLHVNRGTTGLATEVAPRRAEQLELGDVRVPAAPGTMPARAAGFGTTTSRPAAGGLP